MNYVQVQQFLVIAKYMNLSKAAKELYISQPALSLALSRLEKELGLRLFFRDSNKLILSPAGEELYSHFKNLQNAHQTLLQQAELLKRKPDKCLNLGFSGSTVQFLALAQSNPFAKYTRRTVQKIYADPELLTELLVSGQIDFAITYPPLQDERLSSISIAHEEVVLAASAKHPLAKHDSIPLISLTEESFCTQSREFKLRGYIDDILAKVGFFPKYVQECKTLDEFTSLIAEKAGSDDYLAFCPASAFQNVYTNGYKMIHLSDCDLVRVTTLSWLTESKVQYQEKEFIDGIVQDYSKQSDQHSAMLRLYNASLRELSVANDMMEKIHELE